jgi:hypothetical protein
MPTSELFWGWIVCAISVAGYIPVAIGGVKHPIEINVASYLIWFVLTAVVSYSGYKQRHPGWKMTLGWGAGNLTMVIIGLSIGGYSFNLGTAELLAIYGLAITFVVWSAVGAIKRLWSPRILFIGSVAADIISYYPQLKQYFEPHEHPTAWMVSGWLMWWTGSFANILLVERLPQKIWIKPQKILVFVEQSAISLESAILILFTTFVMLH